MTDKSLVRRTTSHGNLKRLEQEIRSHTNKPQAVILQRFFKTGEGQYGAGDQFLGLKVPLQRQIAGKYQDLSLFDVQTLLNGKIHEFRLIALMILVAKYEVATDWNNKQKILEFYLKNTNRINNWDLVDLSVYKLLGNFLLLSDSLPAGSTKVSLKKEYLLNKLACSANLWERRMAMVATYAFIQSGSNQETFTVAERLLEDKHDLIHKAVGWMLRETGKRVSERDLKVFLDKHIKQIPRTALRYAIERLSPRDRERYLSV
jgi:3-methyladenine DNA glycosylase AlkD